MTKMYVVMKHVSAYPKVIPVLICNFEYETRYYINSFNEEEQTYFFVEEVPMYEPSEDELI